MAIRVKRARRSSNEEQKERTWYLTNTRGRHNKFYEVKLERQGALWTISTSYGRIGSTGKPGISKRRTYYHSANKQALKVVQEKVGRGYELQDKEQEAEAQVGDFEDRFSSLE